jgi:aminoglycoside phosphotransferase (APT) family kinase protein
VKEPGPHLASAREADIFEYGPGLVLRRSRHGRSLAGEARIMDYARAQGYPVPAVEEVSDDGLDMVMERVDGVDMVTTMIRRPWTIRQQGRLLADLHRRLHDLAAPDWLRAVPVGDGQRLLHLDLHPLNVLMSRSGPIVIDWTNACRGDPAVDVALTWALMVAGDVPRGRVLSSIITRVRSLLVRSFLDASDEGAARGVLPDVVALKVRDPNMSVVEQGRMWRLVAESGARTL